MFAHLDLLRITRDGPRSAEPLMNRRRLLRRREAEVYRLVIQKREPVVVQRPFQIAQMESELGMTPATDGSCANCGKPLQAGAQFCAYCRTPVAPRPKVCPSCASLALPDAAWCPKCGASLAEEA